MSPDLTEAELFLISSRLIDPAVRPMYLNTGNGGAGWASSLSAAWLSGRAFCCDMRPEVVSVDVDENQLNYLGEFRRIIDESGYPFVEVASSGLSCPKRHFFVWVDDPSERNGLVVNLKGVRGREPVRSGPGQKMRPPGVRHRSGAGASTPVDPGQVRRFLTDRLPALDAILERVRPSTRRDAAAQPPTGDRSRWDQHVIFQMTVDGLSPAEIVQLGVSDRHVFSKKAKEEPSPSRALRYLLASIESALGFYDGSPGRIRTRDDADWYLNRVSRAVADTDPDVFGGQMAARTMEGSIDLFRQQSTIERPISERTLADQAPMHRQTARKWLYHLCTEGWLSCKAAARPGRAATYELNTLKLVPLLGTTGGGCVPNSGPPAKVSRPSLFIWGLAGESGWRAFRALTVLGGEARTGEIAATGHLKDRNIGRVLNRLQDLGIVVRACHGIWRLNDVDVELLAEQWGADLVVKDRRARHELERVAYGQYRLSRLAQLLPPDSLLHLQALDSVNACDRLTGEIVSIDDLWADPTLIPRKVGQ